jgi:hypothetical protein
LTQNSRAPGKEETAQQWSRALSRKCERRIRGASLPAKSGMLDGDLV